MKLACKQGTYNHAIFLASNLCFLFGLCLIALEKNCGTKSGTESLGLRLSFFTNYHKTMITWQHLAPTGLGSKLLGVFFSMVTVANKNDFAQQLEDNLEWFIGHRCENIIYITSRPLTFQQLSHVSPFKVEVKIKCSQVGELNRSQCVLSMWNCR